MNKMQALESEILETKEKIKSARVERAKIEAEKDRLNIAFEAYDEDRDGHVEGKNYIDLMNDWFEQEEKWWTVFFEETALFDDLARLRKRLVRLKLRNLGKD